MKKRGGQWIGGEKGGQMKTVRGVWLFKTRNGKKNSFWNKAGGGKRGGGAGITTPTLHKEEMLITQGGRKVR